MTTIPIFWKIIARLIRMPVMQQAGQLTVRFILPFQVANPVKWVRVQVLTTGRANLTLQVVSITIARFGSGMCILNSNGIMSIVIHTD